VHLELVASNAAVVGMTKMDSLESYSILILNASSAKRILLVYLLMARHALKSALLVSAHKECKQRKLQRRKF